MIDPEAVQKDLSQLWIQFAGEKRSDLTNEMAATLKRDGINVAGIERIDKDYIDAVKYFHEEDRERAKTVLASTAAFRNSNGLPIALRLEAVTEFGGDVPLHHIELWIH